jgi:Na+-translocating ferredoxin:NAD+ oxidoreductase subunit D
MKFITSPGPFIRNRLAKTKQAMFDYTIGLLGLFIFSVGFHWLTHGIEYGVKALGMMITSLIITLFADLLVGALKYQTTDGRLLPYLIQFVKKNYSYVTAVLMTLTLPIGTPYFVLIIGNLFATLIIKYTFGGFGANIFNPAAFGRMFVGIAFASQLTSYLGSISDVPSLSVTGQTITTLFSSTYPEWMGVDLSSMPVSSLWQVYVGNYAGALGETSVLLIIILGSILTLLKAHNWRPTVFFLLTIFLSAFFIGISLGTNPLLYALTFVGLGSVFFGGMFMLTDPVTSPTTNYGKALIGIIAGFVVVYIRTQTSSPEGVVYGIAVANLVSPFIDKFTVGMTNLHLGRKYGLMASLMVGSITFSGLSAIGIEIPSSSSSSIIVIEPYRVYSGEATSFAYPETETPMSLKVDVGVDRQFNIVSIDILEGASSLGSYLTSWNQVKDAIVNTYLMMSVDDILNMVGQPLPNNLTSTGLTITADRLFTAIYNAFSHLQVLEGSAESYACDDETACVDLKVLTAKVYVDQQTNIIEGIAILEDIASSGSYLKTINTNLNAILDTYLGLTKDAILSLNQAPLIEGFEGNQSGVTSP